jgi:hypothetical protein
MARPSFSISQPRLSAGRSAIVKYQRFTCGWSAKSTVCQANARALVKDKIPSNHMLGKLLLQSCCKGDLCLKEAEGESFKPLKGCYGNGLDACNIKLIGWSTVSPMARVGVASVSPHSQMRRSLGEPVVQVMLWLQLVQSMGINDRERGSRYRDAIMRACDVRFVHSHFLQVCAKATG